MDKDNQPTPNKTAYKVPDGQVFAGDQGQMANKSQQVTGVDEMAGRTGASGQTDEQFAQKLEDNIEEIKVVDEAGRQVQDDLAKQAPISEEEAKRLLQEEKRLAEIEYKSARGKNKKTMIVVLVVAAVLCLLGGAFAIVMANRGGDVTGKDDPNNANVDDGGGRDETQKPDSEESGDGSDLERDDDKVVRETIAEIRSIATERLKDYSDRLKLSDTAMDEQIAVYYVPNGMMTAVPLDKVYGFSGDAEYDANFFNTYLDDILPGIMAELEQKGFKKMDGFYTTASAGIADDTLINDTTGVICRVGYIYFGCGHKGWYNEENAKLSDTLARVALDATGENPGLLVARVDQIQNSEVSPYQRIQVARQGFGSMFYRVSPDANWQYFTSGQAGPSCEEYNTEDLKKAFAGMHCFTMDNGYDTTVQP